MKAYNLKQAFDRAFDRISSIEGDITLDKEYSVINSYKVIRDELTSDQKDAMLQLIEAGIGFSNLTKSEYDELYNSVFGGQEEDPKEAAEEAKEEAKEEAEEETAEKATEETPVNPYKIFEESGEDGLKAALEPMGADDLKEIIKRYDLDPTKEARRTKSPERLREIVFIVTRQRATKGDGFI